MQVTLQRTRLLLAGRPITSWGAAAIGWWLRLAWAGQYKSGNGTLESHSGWVARVRRTVL